MEAQVYTHSGPFRLETGHTLPELRIAYHTYGTPNAARDNVVWVCHALTANSDVADWWPHTVEAGRVPRPPGPPLRPPRPRRPQSQKPPRNPAGSAAGQMRCTVQYKAPHRRR